MLRRMLLSATLAACALAPVWAAERATYVLTNGERHNGTIVYGREDNNIVDGKFHVNSSGNELVFEMDDVSVIDFEGGTPSSSERNALPNDTQLMVLRSGATQRGHLHNLIKGDFVQWVNEAGQRNNIPISEVRRLYLKPDNARTSYLQSSGAAPSSAAVQASTVRVNGNEQWVDSGIDVRRGQRIALDASGTVEVSPRTPVNANGARGASNQNFPVPTMGPGGLIAKVGDSQPFAIGAGSHTITMPADGRLMLGINDDNVSDNGGFYSVSVRKSSNLLAR